ncbi:MAG: DUF3352 domain-containing protein [Planctomycetia bacterium]|nr:DUF3352 domain-containing protein [Planctomycetia bacterium]
MRSIFRTAGWSGLLAAGALCVGMGAGRAVAAVPSDQLLPSNTKGYLSVPNLDTLEAEFNKTQWGQLVNDPVMKPFADDLKRQLREKWTKNHDKLGLSWDDMRGVPSGEVGMAKILASRTQAVSAIVADVTGKMPQARDLLKKVDANLTAKNCTRATRQEGDVKLTIYTHPKKPDQKVAEIAVLFLHEKEQQLVACDDLATALAMLKRFSGSRDDSLSHLPAYEVSQAKCRQEAGALEPHLRWFVEPFGYSDAQRISHPERRKPKGQDMVKVLRDQGFTCVQGASGFVNFNDGTHDVLHRTMVYAPAVKRAATDKSQDKYRLAARTLNFPNGGDHLPAAWIPRDLATYVSFNNDLRNSFEYSKTLVDQMADDEIFETVLDSLKKDPSGPQVDIRQEIVAHLGQRVMVFSDYELPITTSSERLLVAIECKDPVPVANAIRKLMSNDPNHVKRMMGDTVVWEVVEQKVVAPKVDLDIDFGAGDPLKNKKAAPKKEEKKQKMLSSKAMAVANGYLLIATHTDILRRVLEQPEPRLSLAGSLDYKLVRDEMHSLGAGNNSCQTFSRTDEEYRPTYELLRRGEMPQSQTLMGKMLNGLLSEKSDDDDEDNPKAREQQLDGSKLPEYDAVRRYLGPAGIFVSSKDDGWFATGFFLSKQASPRVAERQ